MPEVIKRRPGRPKGCKRAPNAGKPKGWLNPAKRTAAAICAQQGVCPITALCRVQKEAIKAKDWKLAKDAAAELAMYTHPRLRSLEISGDVGLTLSDLVKQSYGSGEAGAAAGA